jgi:hypothetical protein
MCYLVNSKQREQYYNETFGGQDEWDTSIQE